MPNFNGRGPVGTGPIGWGRGPCRQGLRRGFGRGFGFRNTAYGPEPYPKTEQKQVLKEDIEELELELQRMKQKLKELEE